jgi:hypothetical protein
MNAGPIVNEISASFDLFWNSEWALPVAAVDGIGIAGGGEFFLFRCLS